MALLITETNHQVELWESKQKETYIVGVFATHGIRNGNGRVYEKKILEREAKNFMNEKIDNKVGWGELGHPEHSDINLKKKAAVTATRTTIEELPFSAQSGLANLNYERTLVSTGRSIGLNAENAVKEAIADDPFCTISELRLILQESMMGTGPNWWGIFKILWSNKLLSRRSRFRFARQRRRRK